MKIKLKIRNRMDDNLVRSLAERISRRNFEKYHSEDIQLHRAKLKDSAGPRLYKELETELKSYVAALKSELDLHGSENDLKFTSTDSGMEISSSRNPFVKFDLPRKQSYDGRFVAVYCCSAGEKPPRGDDQQLDLCLHVASDDTVFMVFKDRPGNAAEIAANIVELLFYSEE